MIKAMYLSVTQSLFSRPELQTTGFAKAHADHAKRLNDFGLRVLGLGQIPLPAAGRDTAGKEIGSEFANDIRHYVKLLAERCTSREHREALLTLLQRYAKDLASAPGGQVSNDILTCLQDTMDQLRLELQAPAQSSTAIQSRQSSYPQGRAPSSAQGQPILQEQPILRSPQPASPIPQRSQQHPSATERPSSATTPLAERPSPALRGHLAQADESGGRTFSERFSEIFRDVMRAGGTVVEQHVHVPLPPHLRRASSDTGSGPVSGQSSSAYVSPWETVAREIEGKIGRGEKLGDYHPALDDLFRASTNPDPVNRKSDSDAKRRIAQDIGSAYADMIFPDPEKGADASGVATFVDNVGRQTPDKRASMLAALAMGSPSVFGLSQSDANGKDVQKIYALMQENAAQVRARVDVLDRPLDSSGNNGAISVVNLNAANQAVLPFAKKIGDILNSPAARNPSATSGV